MSRKKTLSPLGCLLARYCIIATGQETETPVGMARLELASRGQAGEHAARVVTIDFGGQEKGSLFVGPSFGASGSG